MKRLTTLLAAAALCVTMGTARADDYKIGLIADFTGIFSTWGPQFMHSIEAYQSIHGKSVKGPKGETINVNIVTRDTASQGPDKAKQLGEELILREKVNMLAGFDLSPHAMAMAPLSKQAKVPVVIMNAATAMITRMSPYFVRVSMTVPQMVYPMGKWMVDHGMKTAYVLTSDYAPGHDAEEYFIKGYEKAGGKVVGKARSPINNVDFSSYVEKVLQMKPDALYIFMPAGTPSINLVKAFVERGLKAAGIKLVGSRETQQIFLKNFTDGVIGTYTSMHYSENNTNPENIAMKNALHKMFGPKAEPDIASVGAWDGIHLIYEALAALGAHAPGIKYIEFMEGKKLDSPRGPIMIDPKERDVIQNIYIRKVEKVNGELTNVNIDEIPMVKDPWKLEHPMTN
jgi:branched-chain amino acid transport system substrate-binding protein